MQLIHRHVTEWVSVQLRHRIYDAEWPIIHLQILEQILGLFISLSCNLDYSKWPSRTVADICPYLSIQQCGHVVSNTNIGLWTRQQWVTFPARTLIHWIAYIIMQHSVISKTDYRRWFNLHFTFVSIKGVPLLLQPTSRRSETQAKFCTPKVNFAPNMHIQFIFVTLLRFCSSQLTRIHYFTNRRAGSLDPTLISVRSVVQRTDRPNSGQACSRHDNVLHLQLQ